MKYPEQVMSLLSEVAAAGGSLEKLEGCFSEAERLGLIEIELSGGAWGFKEIGRLTNAGRTAIGLPMIVPPVRLPIAARLMRLMSSLGLSRR